MAIATFRATCRKTELVSPTGAKYDRVPVTCDETFVGEEGAKALAVHAKTAHGRSMLKTPAPIKPVAFKAPRATAGGLDRVVEKMAAGDYDAPLSAFGPKEPAGFVEAA